MRLWRVVGSEATSALVTMPGAEGTHLTCSEHPGPWLNEARRDQNNEMSGLGLGVQRESWV